MITGKSYKYDVPVYFSHNTVEWQKRLCKQDNHRTKYMDSGVGQTDGQSMPVTEWHWAGDLPHLSIYLFTSK